MAFRFKQFLFVFLTVGAVLPSLFLLFIEQSASTWDQMVDPTVIPKGLAYTVCASLVFIVIAKLYDPDRARPAHRRARVTTCKPWSRREVAHEQVTRRGSKARKKRIAPLFDGVARQQCNIPSLSTDQSALQAERVASICYYIGVIGLCISSGLSLSYGMSQSNLTPQRPYIAVLAGYVSGGFAVCGTAFFYQEIRLKGASVRLSVYSLLLCLSTAAAWSRSAIFTLVLSISLGVAYSPNCAAMFRRHRLRVAATLAVLLSGAATSTVYGQLYRAGDTAPQLLLLEGFQRLFGNNVALFIAMKRFDDVNFILLDGQPWVLLDQMLSFVRQRTLYPSSFRFVELNGVIAEDARGHITGYAFGWLGLTYGIGGFVGGLLLLGGVVTFYFWGLRICYQKRSSLLGALFFGVFATSLLEFVSNLGLDSFAEKLFKQAMYAILMYFVVSFLKSTFERLSTQHTARAWRRAPV